MPAPSADFPALGASTSSSGYSDGLGRRALAFDREDGTMLERLVVRAELCAFERSLRDRLERIAALDDERIARPRSIERSHDGSLVVLSEFVPGSRLSDLLDGVAQQGSVPGMDVGLGYLLDVLPALCGLHAGAGFAHGAISAGRTVLTPAGQVVLLDGIYGEALSRVQFNRQRLWSEFAIAMVPAGGPPRFDAACDIAQVALCGVMLMLGRPVLPDEYPDAITSLLVEVVEVAQIRGSSEFATGLQRFLQRALPLPGARPYTAADDALIEVRDLARELGLDVCRRALLEFIEQQDGGSATVGVGCRDEAIVDTDFVEEYSYGSGSNGSGDLELESEDEDEIELDLQLGDRAAPEEDTVYDLSAADEPETLEREDHRVPETPADPPAPTAFEADAFVPPVVEPGPPTVEASDAFEPAPFVDEPIGQTALPAGDTPVASEFADAVGELQREAADFETDDHSVDASTAPAAGESEPDDADGFTGDEAQPATEIESRSSRRRKKSRSARSRKDKLRSAARPERLAAPPPPPQPPPRPASPPPAAAPAAAAARTTGSGWLVEPARAASFETSVAPAQPPAPRSAPPPVAAIPMAPPIQPIPMAPPTAAAPPPAPPAVVPLAPPAVVPLAPPAATAPLPMPRPVVPPPQPFAPPAPVQVAPPAPIPLASPQAPALKLKSTPPAPQRKARPEPVEDIYSTRSAPPHVEQAAEFPWKLAAAAVVFIAIAIVGGRAYMSSGSKAADPAPATGTAPPTAAPPVTGAAAKMGKVQIETQPAGARVLLAGKHLGDAPLTIDLPAGRHTLTFATSSDSVRRQIRVEPGKTLTLSVPIYRGWLDVSAPIILEVSENGKHIGSTEQTQLLLSPGRHELTFTNRDLDYTSTQVVEIVPGEAKRLTIDPQGTANLNASPWAEVWINGKKLGETPLANQQLPLGTHEIVFKHPQHGERRMTTTIRANAPVALSVDMTRP